MKTPHSSCPRGKRVRVVLKSGEIFVARFLEKTQKQIVIFDTRQVKVGDMKSFTIVRARAA